MQRTNEIKAIMRQLKEASVNESKNRAVNEALMNEEDETSTENDASETDLVLAKLEDILARFEKVLALSEGDEDEEPADEEPAEDEEDEDKDSEDEEGEDKDDEKDEAYTRRLEKRLANLEKRFTESRRRTLRGSFRR